VYQLAAERREEIGHAIDVEGLQPGGCAFGIREVGAPPLLRAFGREGQASDPNPAPRSTCARSFHPTDERVALLTIV
jgi:hypothetical protein